MEKTSTSIPVSVRALLDLWATRAVAADTIGVPKHRVDAWAKSNSIPAWSHRAVITAAQASGFSFVTADLLADLHAQGRADAGDAA